jgi:acetyltransferase-like isoleucine patch superfamily enzyme
MTVLRELKIRALQVAALYAPGATSLRVWLHRQRGVTLGQDIFIGTDVLLETSRPELVSIGSGVKIGIRTVVIAHFRGKTTAEQRGERYSVRIEDDVFIGPGVIVLPDVTIGYGAVVAAGSVVTSSVSPMTVVQGNPARPVARSGVLLVKSSFADFQRSLKPLR